MSRIHLTTVPELEQRSPGGKYHSHCRNLSLALGGVRNTGQWGGGHPFDLQIRRIPPGAAVCPYHAHLAQWELFMVRSGHGTVRVGDDRHSIRPGDVFFHPPGIAHQLANAGTVDLEVLIVTDNPLLDACHYPDSDKWGLRPPGIFFRLTHADYFEGEEPPSGAGQRVEVRNTNIADYFSAAGRTPFSARLVNLEELAWESWASPRGRFAQAGKQVSVALGAKARQPLTQGGHPFDLEWGRVPAGKTAVPFHSHALQWECYFFQAGTGEFRLGEECFTVSAGDLVLAKPGVPHTFANTGAGDLVYLLVTDDPLADYVIYPDSGKCGFSSPRRTFRPADALYFDGEE